MSLSMVLPMKHDKAKVYVNGIVSVLHHGKHFEVFKELSLLSLGADNNFKELHFSNKLSARGTCHECP